MMMAQNEKSGVTKKDALLQSISNFMEIFLLSHSILSCIQVQRNRINSLGSMNCNLTLSFWYSTCTSKNYDLMVAQDQKLQKSEKKVILWGP